MPNRKILHSEDKLDALRKGNPFQPWESLDDRRVCIVCRKSFIGRQVEFSVSALGHARLHCPTEDCPGTPRVWIQAEKLIPQEVWEDWKRVLDAPEQLRSKREIQSTVGAK